MKKDYMTIGKAERIAAYDMPNDRTGYLAVLEMMGYTKIIGVKSLSEASDRQLKRVADKLYYDAMERFKQHWKAIWEEERIEEAERDYQSRLCDMGNIPKAERENFTKTESDKRTAIATAFFTLPFEVSSIIWPFMTMLCPSPL